MDRNCLFLANSRWEMLFKGYWTAAGYCWKGIGMLLGNAQRLLDSLWAILRGFWKAAGKWPNSRHQPIGYKTELPSGYWLKPGISIPFLWSTTVLLYLSKVQGTVENFKNPQWSSPIFAVSIHTTFNQTQTDATVPLSLFGKKQCIWRISSKLLQKSQDLLIVIAQKIISWFLYFSKVTVLVVTQ
jgi:hypothetical protein